MDYGALNEEGIALAVDAAKQLDEFSVQPFHLRNGQKTGFAH
jgi:hypothetical protein